MKNFYKPLLFLCLCFLSFSSIGQDIHFSQFYTAPLLQNPANAGFFNCDYRLVSNYKMQWRSVTVPYKTFHVSGDIKKISKGKKNDFFGIGMDASVDRAGDSRFTTTQLGVVGSLHHCLDAFGTSYIGGGLMIGLNNGSIDYTNLLFSDQYTSVPSVYKQTAEDISLNQYNFFDISIGGAYNFIETVKKKTVRNSFNIGGAIYHINRPTKSFLSDPASKVYRRYVIHTGANLHASQRFEFYPRLQFSIQGSCHEYLIGSFLRVNLDKMNNTNYGIYFGPWYRIGDALIFVTRFDIGENLSFGLNYDINMSKLTEASNSKGGPELSILYIGCIPSFNKKTVFCPRF